MAFEFVVLPIRIVQIVFAIVCVGLSGYLEGDKYQDQFGDVYNGYGEARYNIFVPCWTVVIGLYLVAATFVPRISHKWVMVALDALTSLFWFAAFIAIAVVRNDIRFIFGNNAYHVAIALAVFGAVEWLLFLISVVLDFLADGYKGGSRGVTGV